MKLIFKEKFDAVQWDGTIEGAQKVAEFINDSVAILVLPDQNPVVESDILSVTLDPGDVVYINSYDEFSVLAMRDLNSEQYLAAEFGDET